MPEYPRISANLNKIRHNAEMIGGLCHAHGVAYAAVTKVVCAEERIVRVLEESGADMLADSRIQNLNRIRSHLPKLLLRAPAPEEAMEAARAADMILVSEEVTIAALGSAAETLKKRLKLILMIDLGDLREGIWFEDRRAIASAAKAVCSCPWLTLHGVGTNLTCYGTILPDEKNLGALCELASILRETLGVPVPVVSGGNSSSVGLLQRGGMPKGVNHLRLGESILLGNDTALCRPIEGAYTDAFTVSARLIEVAKKPSFPVGERGANAFGERPVFLDEGERLRGVLAIGRQDVVAEGLTPRDCGVRVIGASSDHLLVDLSDAGRTYRVGDALDFTPDYGALLRAYTSPYIQKTYE